MEIKGFIGVSLIDWDRKVSSVIFLPSCNLRCPFCYNTKLVLQSSQLPTVPLKKILNYLKKNRGWIDGVVITGGEPTINEDLPLLCQEIKKLDFLVKLDTNGTNPKMIRTLIDNELIDYIAMDVKAPFTEEKYSKASGVSKSAFLAKIEQTTQTLLEGGIDYEFRTTLVPTLHTKSDIREICEKIKGCKKYVLQNFRADVETIDPSFQKLKPFLNAEIESFFHAAKKLVPNTKLRK
jgi:pyruvate formate lyase activating enzyme